MINIESFSGSFGASFHEHLGVAPWNFINNIEKIVREKILSLSQEYIINDSIAIHKTARIEDHCVIKGPAIISAGCFVGAHAYLRGGVFLDERVVVGPGCEIKSSVLLAGTALAHFNFAGDSIIGSNVNMEAGSVIANHYNERKDKTIFILISGKRHAIDSQKFGALVGDGCRIGANAVLSPGTLLEKESTVKRLELIEQCPPL